MQKPCANRDPENTLGMVKSHWVQTKLAPVLYQKLVFCLIKSAAVGGEEAACREVDPGAPWLQETYSLVGEISRPQTEQSARQEAASRMDGCRNNTFLYTGKINTAQNTS